MSFQAVAWAASQRLPALQKIVLIMLANRHNGDTGQCNPSHEKLTDDCGMSGRSIKNQLVELQKAGLIKIVPVFSNNIQRPNQYILMVNSSRQEVQGGEAGGAYRGGQEVPTKQEVLNRKERETLSSDKKIPSPEKELRRRVLKLMLAYPRETPESKVRFVEDAYKTSGAWGNEQKIVEKANSFEKASLPSLETFLINKKKYWDEPSIFYGI